MHSEHVYAALQERGQMSRVMGMVPSSERCEDSLPSPHLDHKDNHRLSEDT
jgi:hypothetical protein